MFPGIKAALALIATDCEGQVPAGPLLLKLMLGGVMLKYLVVLQYPFTISAMYVPGNRLPQLPPVVNAVVLYPWGVYQLMVPVDGAAVAVAEP